MVDANENLDFLKDIIITDTLEGDQMCSKVSYFYLYVDYTKMVA